MSGRKSGAAAGIEAVEGVEGGSSDLAMEAVSDESNPSESNEKASKPERKAKAKATEDQESNGNIGIGDVRKAAAFANSVGGLDKAIALFQILKVAKEVQ